MLQRNNKSNEVLIAEIHETFNTAGDKLLASAMEILNQVGELPMEKAERLRKVGFFNSNEVKKWDAVKMTKELADLIRHYQMFYPMNKFITEEQVAIICKKYKLSCAPIDRYKGFVPDVKLKEIERFKIQNQDKRDVFLKKPEFSYKYSQAVEIKVIKKKYRNGIYPLTSLSPAMIDDVYIRSYDKIENQSLLICAPPKDMDLRGLQKIGAIFTSVVTVSVPDPVVLQPCKGGYLIVAAWGEEASDEIVVNEKHN